MVYVFLYCFCMPLASFELGMGTGQFLLTRGFRLWLRSMHLRSRVMERSPRVYSSNLETKSFQTHCLPSKISSRRATSKSCNKASGIDRCVLVYSTISQSHMVLCGCDLRLKSDRPFSALALTAQTFFSNFFSAATAPFAPTNSTFPQTTS